MEKMTMANSSAGDTVLSTTSQVNEVASVGKKGLARQLFRSESKPGTRKRPLFEFSLRKAEIPRKTPRQDDAKINEKKNNRLQESNSSATVPKIVDKSVPEDTVSEKTQNKTDACINVMKRKCQDHKKEEEEEEEPRDVKVKKVATTLKSDPTKDNIDRLRKTILWLEQGGRKLREELAAVRTELHEERRAAKLTRRELDNAIKQTKQLEAAKYQQIIAEIKASKSTNSNATISSTEISQKQNTVDENQKKELLSLKKKLAEAEQTISKLKSIKTSTDSREVKKRGKHFTNQVQMRKLDNEIQYLREVNRKLEEKLQIVTKAERSRTVEIRVQHENHEAELVALQKSMRSDTIKMADEIQRKEKEIKVLEKLVKERTQLSQKLRVREGIAMRKLRDSEKLHHVSLAPRIEEKIPPEEHAMVISKESCDTISEVERLRELAAEQLKVIEVLRQAVKEKERKLDQLSNKKRKEEFYRQWLELEPVAEVDDEEEHEEDSALSSAPPSLSPQPGGCGQWPTNAVSREAYETVLLEIEELQTKYLEEQEELARAKSQVRDLEKALLQETRGSQNSKRTLNEKLRDYEERESSLMAEVAELREQNELLEFRVLELEEMPNFRGSPEPSEVVLPEPIQLYKDFNKHRDRAVATVIPYTSSYILSEGSPQKSPLSLQESGIFEDDEEDKIQMNAIELASTATQTEAPAGELLQEVQRLQQLRARIQERTAKVQTPSVIDAEVLTDPLPNDFDTQARIRELELRLTSYKETEQKKLQNAIKKAEELREENSRLLERIMLLEHEVRSRGLRRHANASTNTEFLYPQQPKMKSFENSFGRQQNSESEKVLREQVASLESRERTFIETLKQANVIWSKLEEKYNVKNDELQERLDAQMQMNRALIEHLAGMNSDEKESGLMTIDEVDSKCENWQTKMEQDLRDWSRCGVQKMVDAEDLKTVQSDNVSVVLPRLRKSASVASMNDCVATDNVARNSATVKSSPVSLIKEEDRKLTSSSRVEDNQKQIIYFRWK